MARIPLAVEERSRDGEAGEHPSAHELTLRSLDRDVVLDGSEENRRARARIVQLRSRVEVGMVSNRWVVMAALALAACGGTAVEATTDGGGDDASASDAGAGDAAPDSADAGYLACFSASGQLDDSFKQCQTDSECVIEQEQTDCCGTILYVGVTTSSVASFDSCEAAWVAHFPGCGCASGQTMTEDGQTTHPGTDAAAPAVHCADFTENGGICLTYTP
jgi:hypothetical protein